MAQSTRALEWSRPEQGEPFHHDHINDCIRLATAWDPELCLRDWRVVLRTVPSHVVTTCRWFGPGDSAFRYDGQVSQQPSIKSYHVRKGRRRLWLAIGWQASG